MSFSSETKDAILKKRLRSDRENMILLTAITAAIGTVTLRRGRGIGIKYTTESLQVARLIARCAMRLFDVDSEIAVHEKNARPAARNTQISLFGKDAEKILCVSGLLEDEDTPRELPANRKECIAYIKGAFLSCGSVTDPHKSYHLEIVCKNEMAALSCIEYAKKAGLAMKYVKRKDSHVAYLKDGESISSFLSLTGADDAVLSFENVRVYRDTRNYANRTRNCDMANITKSSNAAMHQVAEIEFLLKNSSAEIPDALFETATARLKHPHATLSEFAEIIGMGKSGANHRLQKLLAMARELHNMLGE